VEPLQAGDPPYVGAYRLTARLGAGGMGRVFLGVSPGGRKVAVKLMLPGHSGDWEFRQRFAREVVAARRVGGFHTASVVDADPAADPPWMVTAYIPGPSLDEVVRSTGPLAPSALRALAAGLAEGLCAVHAVGLVHRDLKPGNVIMAEDGPRIIDFGIARATNSTSLTSSGVLVGTFSFMSPEQVRGDRIGPESDVFSLGSVLAYAAMGYGPFDAATVPAIIHRIATEPPDLGSLSGPLRDVISACLAKNPADRPAPGLLLGVLSDVPGQFAPGRQPSVPASPRIAPPGAAPSTGSTPGKPGRFPAGRVALAGAFAAVLAMAITLGVVLGTRGSTGSHVGTTGAASSHQPGTGQPHASGAPASPAASTTAAPASWTTVCTKPIDTCTGVGVDALQTEPSKIILSEDGSGYVKDLTWSGWGTGTATGTGTLEVDNCSPNCAQGHDTPYSATVTLTHLAPYGDGEQAYSAIAISVPGSPSHSQTFSTRLVP
jgi:Protein kinase domain